MNYLAQDTNEDKYEQNKNYNTEYYEPHKILLVKPGAREW